MTVREVYEAVLVEINKENAPSFTVEEFNYLLNKAVLAYVNEKYNFYAANQQLSDDLRVLLKTSKHKISDTTNPEDYTWNKVRGVIAGTDTPSGYLVTNVSDIKTGDIVGWGDAPDANYLVIDSIAPSVNSYPLFTIDGTVTGTAPEKGQQLYLRTAPIKETDIYGVSELGTADTFSNDQTIDLALAASDYLHILSCRIVMAGSKYSYTSTDNVTYLTFPAKRLTFDMLNFIENNAYLRPARNRPYFQVFDNKENFGSVKISTDDPNSREYQNKPKFKLYIGRDNHVLAPKMIYIDYLKMPNYVLLDDIDLFSAGEDMSQVLEFPDYTKNEIVKRVAAYLLEKTQDPRIQTQPQLNQEIPNVPMNIQMQSAARGTTPAQQQAAQQQQQQ